MPFDQLRCDNWPGQHVPTLWTPPLQHMTDFRLEPLPVKSTETDMMYFNTNRVVQSKNMLACMPPTSHPSHPELLEPTSAPDSIRTFVNVDYFDSTTPTEKVQGWLHGGQIPLPERSVDPRKLSRAGYTGPGQQSPHFLPLNNPAALEKENRDCGRLHITFLPAEGRTSDGTSKFGRIAEIIRLQDGTVKLFAERGRVIDTRITYEPWDSRLTGDPLRLRFTPYSSCAGVIQPVIGSHNQLQKPSCPQMTQVCFVQLGQRGQEIDSAECYYEWDEENYLSMLIPLAGSRGIYPLVFPFHNSQCSSTYRKTVYVRVSVIRSDGAELAATRFEIVSCASPLRDIQRFQMKLKGKRKSIREEGDFQSRRKTNLTTTDLDISPGSSGFASSSSPINCAWPEEDSGISLNLDMPTNYDCNHREANRDGAVEIGNKSANERMKSNQLGPDTDAKPSTTTHETARIVEYQSASEEYVIKTKDYRIYRVLQALERELSTVYGP